mgnify:FL=1
MKYDIAVIGGGIEADADTIGKVALGAVAAGAAVHAVASNISKRKDLDRRIHNAIENEKRVED